MAQRFITLGYENFEGWDMEEWRKLIIITLMFAILFTSYSIIRAEAWYKLHGDYGYDLEVFSESLDSTLSGRSFFFNMKEWQEFGAWSHFGAHNSPILFLLLPVYALYPSVYSLLVIQALAVAFASIILFELAREVLNDERKAFTVSLAYLLNPLTHGLIRYEFHPCVLGVPFMFLFAYYMARENIKKAFIAALFVLSVKEDAGLFLIAYAIFEVLKKHGFKVKEWFSERRAIGFGVLGAVWILTSIFVVIPQFNIHGVYPYFGLYQTTSAGYFIIALVKLFVAFLSVAFIPVRPRYSLPVVLLWLENAFSTRLSQVIIGFQYDYIMVPMLFIVLIYALREQRTTIKLLLASSTLTTLLFSPLWSPFDLFPIVALDRFWVLLKIIWR